MQRVERFQGVEKAGQRRPVLETALPREVLVAESCFCAGAHRAIFIVIFPGYVRKSPPRRVITDCEYETVSVGDEASA